MSSTTVSDPQYFHWFCCPETYQLCWRKIGVSLLKKKKKTAKSKTLNIGWQDIILLSLWNIEHYLKMCVLSYFITQSDSQLRKIHPFRYTKPINFTTCCKQNNSFLSQWAVIVCAYFSFTPKLLFQIHN